MGFNSGFKGLNLESGHSEVWRVVRRKEDASYVKGKRMRNKYCPNVRRHKNG